jgi:GNAT superfamily N-acetyltransferase
MLTTYQLCITVRHAVQVDVPLILNLIQKKAKFDTEIGSFCGALCATEELLNKTLFNDAPFAKILFAEVDGNAVGFASYYFRYSSFKAQPSLWLDDLYVENAVRSQGIGTALIENLIEVAQAQNCSHLAWNAWKDNYRAVKFYHRIGGKLVEAKDKSLLFQLNELAAVPTLSEAG